MNKDLKSKLNQGMSRITLKQVFVLIAFGVGVALISCIVGYFQFRNAIHSTYEKEATQIIQYIESGLNVDQMSQNIELVMNDFGNDAIKDEVSQQPDYSTLVAELEKIQQNFDCPNVAIIAASDTFKDEYVRILEEQGGEENLQKLQAIEDSGDSLMGLIYAFSTNDPNDEHGSPKRAVLLTGEDKTIIDNIYKNKTREVIISEFEPEPNSDNKVQTMTVYEPILNGSDQVVAVINVDLTMRMIWGDITRFMSLVALYNLTFGVAFIIIFILINRHILIKPILSIIGNIRTFVENDNQISDSLQDIQTHDEIQYLAESVLKMENDINDYIDNLEQVTMERERVKTELDLASKIQNSVLPQTFPAFPNRDEFDIYALMDPAREVGGDFYNFYLIDDDHLGVVIGDVSGKGVPAALFMMIGSILIKAQSLPNQKANEIFEKANSILSNNNSELLFITAWMGIYEISTNTMTFVNAGHEPPLVVHENGEAEFINTKPNLVLASFDGIPYKLHEMKLNKGDKIFLYTDGVPEAQNEAQEFYKLDRFAEVVKKFYKESVETIIKEARSDIDIFVDGADQFDDITMVGLEIKNDPKEE